MASFNKVILLGNVGKDPEVRYMPNGDAVANVSLATSNRWKDKNTGEMMEATQWHRLTFYRRNAEIVGEYVKSGSPIHIEGSLKYGSYEKDGTKHYTTEIVVDSLQLLGQRPERQGNPAPQSAQRPAAAGQGRPASGSYGDTKGRAAPRSAPATGNQARPASGFDDMDDDIPFVTASMHYDMTTSKSRKMARYDY